MLYWKKVMVFIFVLLMVTVVASAQQQLQRGTTYLTDAISEGKLRARFKGMGSRSGNAIMGIFEKTAKAGSKPLRLKVRPGMRIRPKGGVDEQDKVIAAVVGLMQSEYSQKYSQRSEIVLYDNKPQIYLFEAYCAEFSKAIPTRQTEFEIESGHHTDALVSKVLERVENTPGMSVQAKQAAVWAVTDNLTYGQMKQKVRISKEEWDKGVEAVEASGGSAPGSRSKRINYCRQYADQALQQISVRIERTGSVPTNDPVWKKDFNHHYKWCLGASKSSANQGSKMRQDWLNSHSAAKSGNSKEAFCRKYTKNALRQIQIRKRMGSKVPAVMPAPNDPVWKEDFNHHYKWCLGAPESSANQGSKMRQDWLNEHRIK